MAFQTRLSSRKFEEGNLALEKPAMELENERDDDTRNEAIAKERDSADVAAASAPLSPVGSRSPEDAHDCFGNFEELTFASPASTVAGYKRCASDAGLTDVASSDVASGYPP